jgi:hypothetical protein
MLSNRDKSINFPQDGEVKEVSFISTRRGIEGKISGFHCKETHAYPQHGFSPEADSSWECRLHKKTQFLYFLEPLRILRSKTEHDNAILDRVRGDVMQSLRNLANIQVCIDLFGDQYWWLEDRAAQSGFSKEEIQAEVSRIIKAWVNGEKIGAIWIQKEVQAQTEKLEEEVIT